MTSDIALVLLYEPRTAKGRPVPIARVDDPRLINQAARSAIMAAQERADALLDVDDVLGAVGVEEVRRLKAVFRVLMPEIAAGRAGRSTGR
jgi:hypothetical protein